MTDDWEPMAACRGLDPETWFTKAGMGAALAICGRCPVTEACLATVLRREDGMSAGYRHGIFAGLTGPERAALARAREQPTEDAAPGTAAVPEEEPARPVGGRPLAPCGTRPAYQRHLKNGEPVDEACRAANAREAVRYRATGSTQACAAT